MTPIVHRYLQIVFFGFCVQNRDVQLHQTTEVAMIQTTTSRSREPEAESGAGRRGPGETEIQVDKP